MEEAVALECLGAFRFGKKEAGAKYSSRLDGVDIGGIIRGEKESVERDARFGMLTPRKRSTYSSLPGNHRASRPIAQQWRANIQPEQKSK